MLTQIKNSLQNAISMPAQSVAKFFKTGEGQYAEKDKFIGVTVPDLRKIAKKFLCITLEDLKILLESPINQERLLALIILTQQYQRAIQETVKETLYQFYQQNLHCVNNWNLVDASAHLIIGCHLWDKDRSVLIRLARSQNLWKRRISIVSTAYFIRKNDFAWTFKLALLLKNDTEDLIHKAVGWMLREVGRRDQVALITFLDQQASTMPRTMLRYAIEKFPQAQRQQYLLFKPFSLCAEKNK